MSPAKFVVSLLFIVIVSAISAHACSCLGKQTILVEFERSQDVFIAEIKSVEMLKDGDTQFDKYQGVDGARATVEKVFKGSLKPGDDIFLEQGSGANCIWTFRKELVGSKVLIYNSPHEGKRYISECGRSNGLRFVSDDLRYLENLDKVRGKTRISGVYQFGYFGDAPRGHSVAGKRIRIVGARTFTAITDKDGVYEIFDVPAGKYYIEPELPPGWKLNRYAIERSLDTNPPSLSYYEYLESRDKWPNRIPVTVEKGRHVSFDFQFEIDNSVSGQIVGPSGRPMKGICVSAVRADKTDFKYGPSGCSDDRGRFTISELYFTSFVLVINGDRQISGDEPVPMLFYPGVKSRSAAKVINLKQGQKLVLPQFRLPRIVRTITLRGTLFFGDGSPVKSHQKVQFIADVSSSEAKSDPYDYTDDLGRFEIKVLQGQTGRIRGEMIFGERQRLRCPGILNAVIEETYSGSVFTAATLWKTIDAKRNEINLELRFPFRECKVE